MEDTLPATESANEGAQKPNQSTVRKTSNWKLEMIESAIKDIERCEFVALDLG